MLWTIAAPFFTRPDARWIDDAVEGDDIAFRKIPRAADTQNWHDRASRATPLGKWRGYWRQSGAALRDGDGVITVFPQLAFTAAIRRCLSGGRQPIIAWCFNIGAYPTGIKGKIAGRVLREIDHFVVHSRAEIGLLRDWLGVPEDRISFVPLQRAPIPMLESEEQGEPFAVAMGSANRDYPTLIESARISGIPLTIVAAPRLFDGIALPANVTRLSGLSPEECWRLAQRARISIVPLASVDEASGQITVVEAMRMGRPLIATRSAGTVDYVVDGENGLLIPPSDPVALAMAMQKLWDDAALREQIGAAGAAFAQAELCDEKAAERLVALIEKVEAKRAA